MPSIIAQAIKTQGPEAVAALIAEYGAEGSIPWEALARPEQLPPDGDWLFWLLMFGRGGGKTRAGAEETNRTQMANPGQRWYLAGRTAADVRDVMIEGDSGLLSVNRDIHYEPSKRRCTWPNGSVATCYTSEKPDQARGPQFAGGWGDEPAAWIYLEAFFDNLVLATRLGKHPRHILTTTPRPLGWIKDMIENDDCKVSHGSTMANAANLPSIYLEKLRQRYEGTRLYRQEVLGEVLEDFEGAFVTLDMIRSARLRPEPTPAETVAALGIVRVVVGVDPSGGGDEQGIVVKGLDARQHHYTLQDATCNLSPAGWGRRVRDMADIWQADCVAVERNYGGDMAEATVRGSGYGGRINMVTASRGKHVRAEPMCGRYEQGREHHVGEFKELEDQICAVTPKGYEGGKSPNNLDAAVWAGTELDSGVGVSAFGGKIDPNKLAAAKARAQARAAQRMAR